MKNLILFFLLAISSAAFAEKATWDPSEGATGYYLYVWDGHIEKHFTIHGGETTEYEFKLLPGSYEFSMSAFNDVGESNRTEIISHTVEPYQPNDPDEPPAPGVPEKPRGFELIKEGFSQIFKGIKELLS